MSESMWTFEIEDHTPFQGDVIRSAKKKEVESILHAITARAQRKSRKNDCALHFSVVLAPTQEAETPTALICPMDNQSFLIKISEDLYEKLNVQEVGVVFAHELAHVVNGDFSVKSGKDTEHEELQAIAMALELYPNPKAHINQIIKEYEMFRDDGAHINHKTGGYPSYAQMIAAVVKKWTAMAENEKCEAVDRGFLRQLSNRLSNSNANSYGR